MNASIALFAGASHGWRWSDDLERLKRPPFRPSSTDIPCGAAATAEAIGPVRGSGAPRQSTAQSLRSPRPAACPTEAFAGPCRHSRSPSATGFLPAFRERSRHPSPRPSANPPSYRARNRPWARQLGRVAAIALTDQNGPDLGLEKREIGLLIRRCSEQGQRQE